MNALLVDDDRYFVAALREKIDWPSLGIEEVYSAYNIRGAREIIERHAIRVMLCDIEMPQGSGLELLAWIRERAYPVQAIFLTNYADFHYAQKALELQSLDYYLKPVALDKLYPGIAKAVGRAREEEARQMAASGVSRAELLEWFVQRVASGALRGEEALRRAEELRLPLLGRPLLCVLAAFLPDPLASTPGVCPRPARRWKAGCRNAIFVRCRCRAATSGCIWQPAKALHRRNRSPACSARCARKPGTM